MNCIYCNKICYTHNIGSYKHQCLDCNVDYYNKQITGELDVINLFCNINNRRYYVQICDRSPIFLARIMDETDSKVKTVIRVHYVPKVTPHNVERWIKRFLNLMVFS